MQDDSNLKWFQMWNKSAKGKTEMSAKKKYFDSNFNSLIHKACQILSIFTN